MNREHKQKYKHNNNNNKNTENLCKIRWEKYFVVGKL